jgi:tetratricopeptide (TPR) repeat protein
MELRNVSALNRDVARAITLTMQPDRTTDTSTRLADARQVDAEAYDAHLKGRFHLRRPGREELETALHYFNLALAKDPNYAPAHASISQVWGVRRQRGYVTPQVATPRANTAALRALELDSTLAEPHYALATTRTWGDWNWPAAEIAFRNALRLNPNYAEARAYYAHLLSILGRTNEALAEIDRARCRTSPCIRRGMLYAIIRASRTCCDG